MWVFTHVILFQRHTFALFNKLNLFFKIIKKIIFTRRITQKKTLVFFPCSYLLSGTFIIGLLHFTFELIHKIMSEIKVLFYKTWIKMLCVMEYNVLNKIYV